MLAKTIRNKTRGFLQVIRLLFILF